MATVLLPFGLGYYLSYLYRTMNAVIEQQLRTEVGLSPAELGFLTSVYFVSFAAVQLPLGVYLDRLGPRRVQAVLLLVAAAGGALFAIGDGFAALSVGRALIGLGVAGCFMAVLKANALWWPRDRLPLANGVTAAFGSFGALSATLPVELALSVTGWREIFLLIAAATVVIAVGTFLVVPEKPGDGDRVTRLWVQVADIGTIYRDPFFWRPGFMIIAGFAAYISYQTLWAGPWLRDVGGFDRLGVANRLLLIQAGMFVGVITGGLLADRLARTGRALRRVIVGGVSLFLLVQVLLILEVTALAGLLWTAFGIFGASLFLFYSLYAQHYPAGLIGRVNTANNLLLFSAAFAVQWGIGAVIGLWPELADQRYAPDAHRTAFLIVLAFELAAFLWFVWPRAADRETPR